MSHFLQPGEIFDPAKFDRVRTHFENDQQIVLMAESMEPQVHSHLGSDLRLLPNTEGDPQVSYRAVTDLDVGMAWCEARLTQRLVRVLHVGDWRTGSVGYASVHTGRTEVTAASSLVRDVVYEDEFGVHELWQQVRVEWIEGRS